MIEALKSEEIVAKAGGRFKLCALVQKRLADLMEGARPLVEREGRSDLELVIEEIMQDKIALMNPADEAEDGELALAAGPAADEPLL
ncbi:MAG: DNA-directed RNA polymerase subunit omega [Planctomycetota bacterium]